MADQKWNWKNSLLSFLIGFFVGRFTKGGSGPFVSKRSDGTTTEFPEEDIVQAVLLWMAVAKEAGRDLGYDAAISQDEVRSAIRSFDADASLSRARRRYTQEFGEHVSDEEFQQASRQMKRLFANRIVPLLVKLAVSAVPAVPVHVSPVVFELSSRLNDRIFEKLKERNPHDFSSWVPKAVPQLESLLNQWVQQSKPDTYTKPLLQAIHAIKAQM